MSQLGIAKWTYLSSFTPPQKENVCFQLYMRHQTGDGKMADLSYALWLHYHSKSWLKTYRFTVKIYWLDGKTGERQLVKDFTAKVRRFRKCQYVGSITVKEDEARARDGSWLLRDVSAFGCEITYLK